MNKEAAFQNAKKIVDSLAEEGLTFQEATDTIFMAKVILRSLQEAEVEKQKNTALADITRAAQISLTPEGTLIAEVRFNFF